MIIGTNYGSLAPLVSGAGCLTAAAGAVALAWRGRGSWEPSEEDVAAGPQRVGGLVAAVLIAILWATANDSTHNGLLVALAISLAIATVVALLAYSFVISTNTYDIVEMGPSGTVTRKVIGGFGMKTTARDTIRDRNLTTQEFLKGSEYDVDKVWTRPSRAAAKLLFVVCYLVLTVSGTIALASATMLLAHTVD